MAVASGSGRAPSRPWIRLDCEFDRAEWLFGEHFGVRFAWECFLRYVKLRSIKFGIVPQVTLPVLEYEFRIPQEHIERMFEAAVSAGAIVADDDDRRWQVANWVEYQTPDASRAKSRRDQQPSLLDDAETETTSRDQSQPDTCRGTKTETKTTSSIEDGPYQVAERVLNGVAEELDWSPPTEAEVRRYLPRNSPLQELVSEFGEQGTVALFAFAHRTWKHPPTWKSVFGQRNQLREAMAHVAEDAKLEPEFKSIPPADPFEQVGA